MSRTFNNVVLEAGGEGEGELALDGHNVESSMSWYANLNEAAIHISRHPVNNLVEENIGVDTSDKGLLQYYNAPTKAPNVKMPWLIPIHIGMCKLVERSTTNQSTCTMRINGHWY